MWLCFQHVCSESTFLHQILALQRTAILTCSIPQNSSKKVGYDVLDTPATHADPVHENTDIGCHLQIDSTGGCVFASFKHRSGYKLTGKLLCVYCVLLLLIGPMMSPCFVSPSQHPSPTESSTFFFFKQSIQHSTCITAKVCPACGRF